MELDINRANNKKWNIQNQNRAVNANYNLGYNELIYCKVSPKPPMIYKIISQY
jgi:hypothetical protein